MAVFTIEGRADVAAAAADVDDLSASVRGLGDDAARVDDQARQGAGGLDSFGEAGDNVSSKSSQAAGAMGDLAGGLDLIGASGAATALEGVAIATQVAAGAGDVANLVAETSIGRWVVQTSSTIANTVAKGANTVATGVMTGAQAALNAVMAANPIALVVIALAALTAGVILAYKHSETFRGIVDGAFSTARDVVEDVVAAVVEVVDWFGRLPDIARDSWNKVGDAVEKPIEKAQDVVEDLIDFVRDKPREVAGDVAAQFSRMFAPIQDAIEWVQDLIDRVGDIDFPDFPDLNPFSGRAAVSPPTTGPTPTPTAAPQTFVTVTVNGAIDPVETARQILAILSDYANVTVTPNWGTP